MIINFDEIRDLIENGNLSEVSRETGMSWRTLQSYKLTENNWLDNTEKKLTKLQNYINERKEEKVMIKNMSIEDFYNLDEVSVESDGFYFQDDENNISEMVPTPEVAFLPEDEWDGEDYSDHLHPAYLDAWQELQSKVVEAYGN